MPGKDFYAELTLADAVRKLAEHHYEYENRHISRDEYDLLLVAADRIDGHQEDSNDY